MVGIFLRKNEGMNMNRFPKALIDCSSGKYISLLLDGKEVPGAVRIENVSKNAYDECIEITITIYASELKQKGLDRKSVV